MTALTTRPARSLAPDLARGLMLLFIAIANVPWFLWGTPVRVGAHPEPHGTLDAVVQTFMILFVDGRSYPLFAFLFGYGMVQFYRSRLDRGMAPQLVRTALRRRHWAMLLLGFLHALLLFSGDILGAYGVLGLLLVWIFFGRSTRTVRVWLIVLGSVLTLGALFAFVNYAILLLAPPAVLEQIAAQTGPGMHVYKELAHGNDNLLLGVLWRLGIWTMNTAGQVVLMTLPISIMLGWLAARARILDEPWDRVRLLRNTAIIGLTVAVLGALPSALFNLGIFYIPADLNDMFAALFYGTGVLGGVGYAALFGLLAVTLDRRDPSQMGPRTQGPSPQDPKEIRAYGRPAREVGARASSASVLERAIVAIGKRSLTFYLYQSVIFTIVLSSTGFGLGDRVSSPVAFGIAVLTWASSIPLALWLESGDRRGPAEALLRKMTYPKAMRAPQQKAAQEPSTAAPRYQEQ